MMTDPEETKTSIEYPTWNHSELKILELLYEYNRPMFSREIEEELEMPESTVYRVIKSLVKMGAITKRYPRKGDINGSEIFDSYMMNRKGGPVPDVNMLTDEYRSIIERYMEISELASTALELYGEE